MLLPSVMLAFALLVSVVLLWRIAPPGETPTGKGRWAQRSAIVVMALYTLFWAAMGFGEMAGGIPGGEGHLFPAAAALFLAVLGWRRPDIASIVLLLLGAALSLFWLWVLIEGGRPLEWGAILLGLSLLGGPFLLAGFLLWLASGRSTGAGRPREGPA